MDKDEKNTLKNPKEGANCFSLVSFGWLLDIFLLGYKRDLDESDLYVPLKEHKSEHLGNKLTKQWNIELQKCNASKKKRRPNLFRALVRMFGKKFIFLGIIRAFHVLAQRIMDPILLAKVLNYFSPNGTIDKTEATYWALAMCLNLFFECIISHHIVQTLYHMGLQANVACTSVIYRKVLRLAATSSDTSGTTVGQIINLLSNDVSTFDMALIDLHDLWIAPIQLMIITYIVYQDVNWASLLGMATLFLCIPLLGLIGKMFSSAIPKAVYRTDNRLRLMNEIIKGIQTIKMYAWEKPFCSIIERSRIKEMKAIKKVNLLNRLIVSFETYITRICFFISIAAYVYFGNKINGEKVYMMLTYYNSIKSALFISFPLAIQAIYNSKVAMKRIENFLMLDEIHKCAIEKETGDCKLSDIAIYCHHAYAKWRLDSDIEILKDITFNLKSGKMLGIVGQIGSGKSSLLQAIIRELPLSSGSLNVVGKIAYTSQEPWIFSSSIKQNILFGNPFDKERYENVIRVCQLQRDILFMPYGDRTLVGDRGMNLSGGQRARINLARAVYTDADVYLFDDPLSAVDAEVGRRIFEECLSTYLKGKTVVLVTHQIQYMKHMDHIMCLESGRVIIQGTFEKLLNSNTDLAKYLSNIETDIITSTSISNKLIIDNDDDSILDEPDNKEMRTRGKLSSKVYSEYFKAAKSNWLIALVVCLIFLSRLAGIGSDYLVSFWVNAVETTSNATAVNDAKTWYVIWFGSMTLINVIANLIVLSLFFEISLRISKNFHMNMFSNVIHATMNFFYLNPSGRIMSRFARDVQIIDQRLPSSIYEIIDIGINVIFIFFIISYVNTIVILPCIIMVIILYFLRNFFTKTSRNVKRLEGLARSPICDHLTATFQGITTIRALNAEKKLTQEFDSHVDLRVTAYYIFRSSTIAFGMYVDMVATGFMTATIFIFLFVVNDLLPGDVGLVLSQIYSLLGSIQWGIRHTAQVENQMVSVERVIEYTKLEEEPPFESEPENKPPEDWPQKGHIQFVQLCIRYDKEGEKVLNNLNFEILPKEKIGIVGRTGAGKTSLITALFRLAYMEGEIYIDDVPISFLGVHDLRSKISIIPQEPILFEGTLRRNLDPFEEYKDYELWQALEDVKLKVFVERLVAGLNTKVSEGGRNYSIGQRQLLCLARTILKKNKILVLDEATANVDLFTDELIQKTIREKFKDCTVLTVAHRLNTIIDSNRVIIMDNGSLVEIGKPYELLQDKSGYFYDMVRQTGSEMAEMLTNIAKNAMEY